MTRLIEIRLRNFRSFGAQQTTIELPQEPLLTFVGPNGVGKSNVLRAIDILLSSTFEESWIIDDDFHKDSRRFELEGHFEGHTDPIKVTGIRGSPTTLLREGKGPSVDFVFVPAFLLPAQMRIYANEGPATLYRFQRAIDNYLGPGHTIAKQEAFLNLHLARLNQQLAPRLKSKDAGGVELKEVLLNDGVATRVGTKGHGIQRLTALASAVGAINEAHTRPDLCVLGVEEPELYLPPQLCIAVRKVLVEAANNCQVLCTTHSPWLIDPEKPRSILCVSRNEQSETRVRLSKARAAPSDLARMFTKLGQQLHRAFFAEAALVVEGKSDTRVLCEGGRVARLFERLPEEIGWEVIEAGGKGELVAIIKACNFFGIRYSVLWDSDFDTNSDDNDRLNALVKEGQRLRICIAHRALEGTIESFLLDFDSAIAPLSGKVKLQFKGGAQAVSELLQSDPVRQRAAQLARDLFVK